MAHHSPAFFFYWKVLILWEDVSSGVSLFSTSTNSVNTKQEEVGNKDGGQAGRRRRRSSRYQTHGAPTIGEQPTLMMCVGMKIKRGLVKPATKVMANIN